MHNKTVFRLSSQHLNTSVLHFILDFEPLSSTSYSKAKQQEHRQNTQIYSSEINNFTTQNKLFHNTETAEEC